MHLNGLLHVQGSFIGVLTSVQQRLARNSEQTESDDCGMGPHRAHGYVCCLCVRQWGHCCWRQGCPPPNTASRAVTLLFSFCSGRFFSALDTQLYVRICFLPEPSASSKLTHCDQLLMLMYCFQGQPVAALHSHGGFMIHEPLVDAG